MWDCVTCVVGEARNKVRAHNNNNNVNIKNRTVGYGQETVVFAP